MTKEHDYYGMDASFQAPAMPEKTPEPPDLKVSLALLKGLNESAKADLEAVKQSQKLNDFAEKVRQAGAFGAAAQIGKVPEIIPELYPLFDAVKKMDAANETMILIVEQLILKVEGVENVE